MFVDAQRALHMQLLISQSLYAFTVHFNVLFNILHLEENNPRLVSVSFKSTFTHKNSDLNLMLLELCVCVQAKKFKNLH